MATAHKIREGLFLISWINPTYKGTGQTTVNIEEISQSLQLSYSAVGSGANLVVDFQPLSTKVKNPKFLEPSSVTASKYGVRRPMTIQNTKWTTTFPTAYICCGSTGLIFDITIDFNTKLTVPMKSEAKRVLDHLLNLWETKTLADVTFKFDEEKQVQAHTLILASGSPVLAAMFQNDFKEKVERVVEIKDAEPSVFEKLLRFIYTGDADLGDVKPTDLLILADKYGVDSLKEECALRLAKDLSVENATQFLVLSHLHSLTNLYEASLDFMSKNAKAICSRKEWMEVIKNYPELSFVAMQLMVMG